MGMNGKAGDIERDLMEAARPDKVEVLASFFKSGCGEYGEGDVFIGVSVPDNRRVARRHLDAGLDDVRRLLQSPVHEVRLCALLVLVEQYKRGDAAMTSISPSPTASTTGISWTSRANTSSGRS